MDNEKKQKGFKFIKNNDDIIIRNIKEYFEEPKIYLKQNNKIIVGKPFLKKLQISNIINDENKKQIAYAKKNTSSNNKSNNLINNKNALERFSITEINEKKPLSEGIHYEYKTVKEILNSFKEGKKREEKEIKKGTDNLIPKNIREKFKSQYLSQEKNLKRILFENEKDEIFLDYLAKKCRTKKKNLLFNNTENYRIKNQLNDYIENNKNLYEKFGNYCWYIALRRPNLNKKARGNYVNIGKRGKSLWEPIVDFPDNNLEIIKKTEKPYETNYEKFFKENYLWKHQNEKNKFKKNRRYRLINLNDIKNFIIKGKNLISFERENFLKYSIDEKHKYKVFKDPMEENYKCSKNYVYKENYSLNHEKVKTEN